MGTKELQKWWNPWKVFLQNFEALSSLSYLYVCVCVCVNWLDVERLCKSNEGILPFILFGKQKGYFKVWATNIPGSSTMLKGHSLESTPPPPQNSWQQIQLWMHVMLLLTIGHLSNKDRIVCQKPRRAVIIRRLYSIRYFWICEIYLQVSHYVLDNTHHQQSSTR